MNSKIKNPVILIHGYNDTARKMRHIAKNLRDDGWLVYPVTLTPSSGKIGIDELALQLDNFIRDNIQSSQKIDIVGFSMGGLIGRYYVQKLIGHEKVERLITVSTPHNGTLMAYLSRNIASKQMRIHSVFLDNLNKYPDSLKLLKLTSIWTFFDLMIIPASSCRLNIGNNINIGYMIHWFMPHYSKCWKVINIALLK